MGEAIKIIETTPKNNSEANKPNEVSSINYSRLIYNIIKDRNDYERLARGVPRFPHCAESLDKLVEILYDSDEEAIIDILATTSTITEDSTLKRDIIQTNRELLRHVKETKAGKQVLKDYNQLISYSNKANPEIPHSAQIDKINACINHITKTYRNKKPVKNIINIIKQYQNPKYQKHYSQFLNNIESSITKASIYGDRVVDVLRRFEGKDGLIIAHYIKNNVERIKDNKYTPLKRFLHTMKSKEIQKTREALKGADNNPENPDKNKFIRYITEIASELGDENAINQVSETAREYRGKDLELFMQRMRSIGLSSRKPEILEQVAKESKGKKRKELKKFLDSIVYICNTNKDDETIAKVINNYNQLDKKERSDYIKGIKDIGEHDSTIIKEVANLPEQGIRGRHLKKRLKEIKKATKKERNPYETKELVDNIKKEENLDKKSSSIKYNIDSTLESETNDLAASFNSYRRLDYLQKIEELTKNLHENRLDSDNIIESLNESLKGMKSNKVREKKLVQIVKEFNSFTKRNRHSSVPRNIMNSVYEGLVSGLRYLPKGLLSDIDLIGCRGTGSLLEEYFERGYNIGVRSLSPNKSHEENKQALESVIKGGSSLDRVSSFTKYLKTIEALSKRSIYEPEALESIGKYAQKILPMKGFGYLKRSLKKAMKKAKKEPWKTIPQIISSL